MTRKEIIGKLRIGWALRQSRVTSAWTIRDPLDGAIYGGIHRKTARRLLVEWPGGLVHHVSGDFDYYHRPGAYALPRVCYKSRLESAQL